MSAGAAATLFLVLKNAYSVYVAVLQLLQGTKKKKKKKKNAKKKIRISFEIFFFFLKKKKKKEKKKTMPQNKCEDVWKFFCVF
jgi:hypothetical protein